MNISQLDKAQVVKVLKAIAYSFVSGFVATLSLMSVNFIAAAQTGTGTVVDLAVALVAAAVVGGINGVAVYIKQLFTETK